MFKKNLFKFLLLTLTLGFQQFLFAQENQCYFIDQSVSQSELISHELETINGNSFQLVSHGKPGHLMIDGKWLNAQQISNWLQPRMTSEINHLNIYGCEFGKGEIGKKAVQYLEKKLNVPVSASTNITGKGGDWTLEIGVSDGNSLNIDYPYSLQECKVPIRFRVYVYYRNIGVACNSTNYLISGATNTIVDVDQTMPPADYFYQELLWNRIATGIDINPVGNKVSVRLRGSGSSCASGYVNADAILLIDNLGNHYVINDVNPVSGVNGSTTTAVANGADWSIESLATNYNSEAHIFNKKTATDNNNFTWTLSFEDADGNGVPDSCDPCLVRPDNPDSDGDGLADGCDTDDDNDGIPDCSESYTGSINLDSGGQLANYVNHSLAPDGITFSELNGSLDPAYTGNRGGYPKGLGGGQFLMYTKGNETSAFDFNFTQPFDLVINYPDVFVGGGFFLTTDEEEIFESDQPMVLSDPNKQLLVWNGTAFVTLNSPKTDYKIRFKLNPDNASIQNNSLGAGLGTFSFSIPNATNFKWTQIALTNADNGCRFNFESNCMDRDTDGDGIPDRLDNDADNDGCPDALEGAGSTYKLSDLNPDGSINTDLYPIDTDPASPTYGSPGSSANGPGTSNKNGLQAGACGFLPTDDVNVTPMDTPVMGNIFTNDINSLNNVTITEPTPDPNGTLVINPDGSYTFTPNTGFTGTVVYDIELCDDQVPPVCTISTLTIDVLPILDPSANNTVNATNDTNTVEQGSTVTTNVLANDSDPDGDPLTLLGVTALDATGNKIDLTDVPQEIYDANGNLAGVASIVGGEVVFTADANFIGDVPLEYTIEDGNGATDSASLIISVKNNDGYNGVVANDDSSVGAMDQPQAGNVFTNDYDPEGDAMVLTGATDSSGNTLAVDGSENTLPSGGTLILNPDGSYTYTPAPGFVGTEVITYQLCDDQTPPACEEATLYLTTLSLIIITPVELSYFDVQSLGADATLIWKTESELNSSHFVIQRSLNGVYFDDVEQIKSAGNSQQEISYTYTDKSAGYRGSLMYYRLKQVNLDGQFAFTSVRLVKFDEELAISTSIFPNPTSRGENVLVQSENISQITVYNTFGGSEDTYSFDQPVQSTTINTSRLSSGLYFIVINNNQVKKLIIE